MILGFIKSAATSAYNKAKNITAKKAVLGIAEFTYSGINSVALTALVMTTALALSKLSAPTGKVVTGLAVGYLALGYIINKIKTDEIQAKYNESTNLFKNGFRERFLSNLDGSVMSYIVDNGLGEKDLSELRNNEIFYNMLNEAEKDWLNILLSLPKQKVEYQV